MNVSHYTNSDWRCLRSKIEGNILGTESQKFSIMIDMPVTTVFVLLYLKTKTKSLNKNHLNKKKLGLL